MTNLALTQHLKLTRILSGLILILVSSITECRTNNLPAPNNIDLLNKFYKYSKTSIQYLDKNRLSDEELIYIAKFQEIGIEVPSDYLNLIKITYSNTNLPQYAIHIRSKASNQLIVYNHGHGGLPTIKEQFAIDFIISAIKLKTDVLITSMPLVGLNEIDPSKEYWAKFFGNTNKQKIDNAIIKPWVLSHSIYQSIDDEDHFLHFFLDPIVLISLKIMENISELPESVTYSNFPSLYYEKIFYIGLSGGGNIGLSACAIVPFNKCILIAGFLPFYLSAQNIKSWGDAEQTADSIYRTYPYEQLMDLANKKSKMIYIYNDEDPCCFSNPEATIFKNDFPLFDIRIRHNTNHSYEPNYLIESLLQKNKF